MTQTNLSELRQAAIVNRLRSSQLFSGLPVTDLQQIAAIAVLKSVDKGDYLFREGAPSHGFYIVQSGAISVHKLSASGKEQVIHVFRAGESFAEAALATAKGYPADARAIEPSELLLVEKAGFVALLKQQPELALRMLSSMSLHLRMLVAQIEDLTSKDVETRLANWLVRQCPNPKSETSVTIELHSTKRDLAAELGTVSETFSRTLAKFRDQKLIVVNGKFLTIVSPARLNSVLERHLGTML